MFNFTNMLQQFSIMIFCAEMLMFMHSESMIFILIRRLVQRLSMKWTFLTIWVIIVLSSRMSSKYRFNQIYFWYSCVQLSISQTVILFLIFWIEHLDKYFHRNFLLISNIIHSVLKQINLMKFLLDPNQKNIVM